MSLQIRLTPGRVVAIGDLITEDVLNALANPTVELEGTVATSGIDDGSITLAKLIVGILTADTPGRSRMADAFVTAAKLASALDFSGGTFRPPAGMLVQQFYAEEKSILSTASVIPLDDVLPGPQITEGLGLPTLDITITAKAITNIWEIDVFIPVINATSSTQIVTLFQTTAAAPSTAIAVGYIGLAGLAGQLTLRHRMVAGTLSATTFSLRIGVNSGTVSINAFSAAHVFAPINAARIYVKEITAI